MLARPVRVEPAVPKEPVIETDDRVLRLGAEWYAEVRRKTEPEPPRKRASGEDGGGFLDWLFGDGSSDAAGDAGGDGGGD